MEFLQLGVVFLVKFILPALGTLVAKIDAATQRPGLARGAEVVDLVRTALRGAGEKLGKGMLPPCGGQIRRRGTREGGLEMESFDTRNVKPMAELLKFTAPP